MVTSTTAVTATTTAGSGPPVTNLSCSDRICTAVAVSQQEFPNGGAKAVVIARDDVFADALTGVPFAAANTAPLLLSDPGALSSVTETEMKRVLPAGGTVYLLGGTDALSTAVSNTVTADGYNVVRIGGIDRFATAVLIAQALGSPKTLFEVNGLDFPDALPAGPAAASVKGAIVLTNGNVQDATTAAFITSDAPTAKYALGGPAAAADPSATPIVGTDRYGTAAMTAAQFFPKATTVGASTGLNWPDALSGGTYMASIDGPILLVDPSDTTAASIPALTAQYLQGLEPGLGLIYTFGGYEALPTAVGSALAAAAASG